MVVPFNLVGLHSHKIQPASEGRGGLFYLTVGAATAQHWLYCSLYPSQASILGNLLSEFRFCMFSRNADSIVLILLTCFCCREAEMRNSILAQVLDQSARARCKHLQFPLSSFHNPYLS